MEEQNIPHLGKILKQLLKEKNVSVKKFASLIGYDFRGVYQMLKRRNSDTDLLFLISQALNHDMFQYFHNENSPAGKKLSEKISTLEKENTELKTEITYLKEIVRLKGK